MNSDVMLEKKMGNYHRLYPDGIFMISIVGKPEGYIIKDDYLVQIDEEDTTWVDYVFK